MILHVDVKAQKTSDPKVFRQLYLVFQVIQTYTKNMPRPQKVTRRQFSYFWKEIVPLITLNPGKWKIVVKKILLYIFDTIFYPQFKLALSLEVQFVCLLYPDRYFLILYFKNQIRYQQRSVEDHSRVFTRESSQDYPYPEPIVYLIVIIMLICCILRYGII